MTAITFETTISPDGMLHLFVPGAAPGSEVEVSVSPKLPANSDNRWPADFHERMYGCIADDSFIRHAQPLLPSAVESD